MLIHLVCFKYKPEVPEQDREAHRRRLAALSTLDGVLELKVGADLVRNARSYDTGLMIRFPDRAALDAYQKNPQHLPVAELGVSLADHVVAVDFME